MDEIKPGCIYCWSKANGERVFVYVNTNEDGKCDVSPVDLVLDVNQHESVSAAELESLQMRPIPLDLFSDC